MTPINQVAILDADILRARENLAKLEDQRKDVRANKQILCAACHKMHAIKDLTLVVTNFYISPYGCTGGDYWKEGEWRFICPEKGWQNRMLFNNSWIDWRERDKFGVAPEPTFKRLYRGLFKDSIETHNDGIEKSSSWVNNFYVDEHADDFDLPSKPKEVTGSKPIPKWEM